MAYSPPVGTVDLDLTGAYTPKVGVVNLDLSITSTTVRHLNIAAVTGGALVTAEIRGESLYTIAAVTGGALAFVEVAYDPNLLSDTVNSTRSPWRESEALRCGPASFWREATRLPWGATEAWRTASQAVRDGILRWRESLHADAPGIAAWKDSALQNAAEVSSWRDSGRITGDHRLTWREADRLGRGEANQWIKTLPLLLLHLRAGWSQGNQQPTGIEARFGDGPRLITVQIPRWRTAGYPSNKRKVPPAPHLPPPDYIPPVGVVDLDLACPLKAWVGVVNLDLGRSPCPRIPAWIMPTQRSYYVLNQVSLVRLPDRTPLPVTSMTIETDCDSWCWSLTATLAGPTGWPLVQPQAPGFLPVEVEAAINGHVWKFLLDAPSASRTFGSDTATLKGRSRSAWLGSPFTAPSAGIEANPRTAQQLAEQALENLGWTLVWNLPEDWLIPGGLYAWNGTPMDQLTSLVRPVDGCLATDPWDEIITAYPRYPSASWLWGGITPDLGIPESALLSWSSTPDQRELLNGCYVSGSVAGYLAWIKIAGTDGARIPPEPVVDPLLCHVDALRARGLSILSAAGPGVDLSAELLLTQHGGTGPGLVTPGKLVEVIGVRGMVRSTRIAAQWSGNLTVIQSIGIERREVEA